MVRKRINYSGLILRVCRGDQSRTGIGKIQINIWIRIVVIGVNALQDKWNTVKCRDTTPYLKSSVPEESSNIKKKSSWRMPRIFRIDESCQSILSSEARREKNRVQLGL